MSRIKCIFVHGLSGWGSYDQAYSRMPYRGMRGGDLMAPQGGLMRRHDVRAFYLDLLAMLEGLSEPSVTEG